MVAYDKSNERLIEKRDLIHIAILAAIALVVGVYLIATTVLISKDGVFYIERAQQLASDPIKIIKAHPPGYPFLIMAAHKCAALFTNESSVFTWIYSAQSVTLLCRLLALIPLYFIGKLLVGSKNSFWAVLILVLLPHSAKYCAEVLREWPYILFLAAGFFFLLWGAKSRKWWVFGFVGLCSGLGYLIRPESVQLIVYGFVWLILCMLWAKRWNVSRWKIIVALALLFIGFAIPATPYMKCTGRYFPPKAGFFIKSFFSTNSSNNIDTTKISLAASILNYNTAEIASQNVLEALYGIFQTIGEHLMWFFVLPLVIGLWYWLRGEAKFEEQFLITAFVLANIAMMTLQYCYNSPEVSRRWSLPLIAMTICYVPVGLQTLGNWLGSRLHKSQRKNEGNPQLWFFILLVVGVIICLPKLFRPTGIDKAGYREAAKWLKENTNKNDLIAMSDRRIVFYADRPMEKIQSGTSTISGGQITSKSWYHIAGTYDGKYQKLYLNGKLVSSAEPGFGLLSAGRDNLVIGKSNADCRLYFKGVIDEARLYGRSLLESEIEALYNGHIHEIKTLALIGYWPLDNEAPGINSRPNSAMAFNGTSDCIDLSHLGSRLDVNNLSVSLWTKPELLKRMNWLLGNRAQFRIGIYNSEVYFWIQEGPPGNKIPSEAAYVVAFAKEGSTETETSFNKRVQKKYSVWSNERKKRKRIIIYKVL